MNIIRNRTQGIVVGETPLCYRVKPVATKTVLWPKQYCRIDHDFYASQLAMHLWHGYQSEQEDQGRIDIVDGISAFVPALLLASNKLSAQIEAGRDNWDKVFFYDVAQAGGAWLAANPKATVEQFTAKLEELIA